MSGKARRTDQYKGVICLEADQWYGQKDQTSVEPMLRMLEGMKDLRIPYEHRTIATFEELKYCLNRYLKRTYKTHPLLYFAFHGRGADGENESGIDLPGDEDLVKLSELGDLMENQCTNRVIHFGSCSVLNTDEEKIDTFLRVTGAKAVCGYREDADWIEAAAFEMLILAKIQPRNLGRKDSIRKFDKDLRSAAPGLSNKLGFRLIVRD